MLRTLLVLVVSALGLATPVASVAAQEKEAGAPERKPSPTLKVGDPAPRLDVRSWLQGEGVTAFEPGEVYVVEFWSTSCGPCIGFMPHLAALQEQYKDKGVAIVGCMAAAFNDTEDKAAAFVKKRGLGLKYRFAYAGDRMVEAWMGAAGREGLPCTFVVDKEGRVAYIGHPMYLVAVLPKVVAGTSTAKAVGLGGTLG